MHNLTFNNPALLEEALTHRSFLNEQKDVAHHNERLEFLGDAVLELVISDFLYKKYPIKPEGELTAFRASLVKTTTLAEVSSTLGLGAQLSMSKGEEQGGGRENPSLLANTFEAVVGALYLDQGIDACTTFITTHLTPLLPQIVSQGLYKDHKSSLQELVQAKGSESPLYQVVNASGPDHDKEFEVEVFVDQQPVASGKGKSKQSASQAAAKGALEKLTNA